MPDPLWERLLVAAIGPVVTAALALLVVNLATSRLQRRREAAEIRASLAAELAETGNALYYGLQAFWRAAKDVPLGARKTEPGLAGARENIADLYVRQRVQGKVLEERLRIYYADRRPAQTWHRAMALLSTRYFLLLDGTQEGRDGVRQRNAGDSETGLTLSQLNEPALLLRAYRHALQETLRLLWACEVDGRGKHMHTYRPDDANEPPTGE